MVFPLPLPCARRALVALMLSLSWAALAPTAAAAEPAAIPANTPAPGESALLSRLVAPCCWTQTLDIHAGTAPDTFRAEIHTRLLAGETPTSIEDDFIARYGKAVLAQPRDSPLPHVALALAALALAAAAALVLSLRRWTRHGQAAAMSPLASPASPEARDLWDDRLDDELRNLER